LAMAARLVPSLAGAPFVTAWAGLRPACPDRLPILGPLPGWENVALATGHFRNGVLLAPLTGSLLADWLLYRRTSPLMEPFTPNAPSRLGAAPPTAAPPPPCPAR